MNAVLIVRALIVFAVLGLVAVIAFHSQHPVAVLSSFAAVLTALAAVVGALL